MLGSQGKGVRRRERFRGSERGRENWRKVILEGLCSCFCPLVHFFFLSHRHKINNLFPSLFLSSLFFFSSSLLYLLDSPLFLLPPSSSFHFQALSLSLSLFPPFPTSFPVLLLLSQLSHFPAFFPHRLSFLPLPAPPLFPA